MHDVCCHDAETPAIYLKFTISGISHWLVINAHFLENYKTCSLQAFLQHAKVFASTSEKRKWKIMSITPLHVFQTLEGWFLETNSAFKWELSILCESTVILGQNMKAKFDSLDLIDLLFTLILKKEENLCGGTAQMDSHLKRDKNLLFYCL